MQPAAKPRSFYLWRRRVAGRRGLGSRGRRPAFRAQALCGDRGRHTVVADWTHGEALVGSLRLHFVEAGTGPLVVLLHGFPEHGYAWRHQIPALARAGFRVVAPDMRGYNLSDKPRGVRRYRVEELAADVVGLARHFGVSQAHVVGHDWGGLVAWWTAMLHPEMVSRLAILNAPHPAVVRRGLFRHGQLRKSQYIFWFQIPVLAERRFAADDFAVLRRRLRRDPVHPSAFSDEATGCNPTLRRA